MPISCLAIVGPTASGKTVLGLRLAREQNGEIISVDSRQVYQFLPVGTAQPTDTGGLPYHLINFLDPKESFSAAQFAERAKSLIQDIAARGKTPILVGGTGFYFRALTEGLAPLPSADPEIRSELRRIADEMGRLFLHDELTRVDPHAAQKIPANNIQRVIRALEVFKLTGKPISKWHEEHQRVPSSGLRPSSPSGRGISSESLSIIGLYPGKEVMEQRIRDRAAWMLDNGMIDEAQSLLKRGYPETCPGLTGLGYPRVVAYLKGTLKRDELLTLLIQDTRQYAKRQMTWFRNQMKVEWKKS
jgi:tRNA dimethylallyltransferase